MGKKHSSKWDSVFNSNPRNDGELIKGYHQRLMPELEKIGYTKNERSFRDAYAHYRKRKKKITSDKKVGDFHWKDWSKYAKKGQRLYDKQKESQDFSNWHIDTNKPICVVGIGDLQIGSWGTDMEALERITDEIINTPNLYVILLGDLIQMSVKLRGVKEAHDNLIPVDIQMKFLESWLADIEHKVIASTWDNHAVMREENQIGLSRYAEIMKGRVIYGSGIHHLDLGVGDQVYKFAISHFFRGRSLLNPAHAPMRYLRFEGVDRDIAMQGDFHVPSIIKYREGQRDLVASVCGTIQKNSGYAKRFFSLFTSDAMPAVILYPDRKNILPLWSVSEWLDFLGRSNKKENGKYDFS